MILDRKQIKWVVTTGIAAIILTAAYVIYVWPSPNTPRGGSLMGLIFGSLGAGIFVFESLLTLRKRFSASRVGRAQTWLRAHLWLGILSFPLVLMHSGFRWGSGLAAVLMWLVFAVVASGVAGIVLQNYLPRRMQEEVERETIFDQIPHVIRALRVDADERVQFVTGSLNGGKHADLAGKYANRSGKRNRSTASQPWEDQLPLVEITADAKHILQTRYKQDVRPYLQDTISASSKRLFKTRESIRAYFSDLATSMPLSVHRILNDLEDICEERRQFAIQKTIHYWLHGWLLVHVPLSFALLVLTFLHAMLSLRY